MDNLRQIDMDWSTLPIVPFADDGFTQRSVLVYSTTAVEHAAIGSMRPRRDQKNPALRSSP